jgi:hypothetical protein
MEIDPTQNRIAGGNSILNLTRSSGLIFSGTVVRLGESTVPSLPPDKDFVVIKVERGLRVDPVLGDLKGKLITMAPAKPGSLRPEERAVFFTHSWIHGDGIAVRELAHADVQAEPEVAALVERLPEFHLADRLLAAKLVVVAEVVEIKHLKRTSYERDAALWAAAQLRIERVLRGVPTEPVIVYFPTSVGPPWFNAPRFEVRQRGVFILHAPSDKTLSDKSLPSDGLVALDPTDFLPESRLPQVEKVLAGFDQEGATS